MCGIFGVVLADRRVTPDVGLLEQSAAILRHRGPDAFGTHAEPGFGFAHTRLSLLDLSERGTQPFWDPGQRRCVTYNGEIYNFKELRSELEQRGVEFHTTTDTEVLLWSLVEHGVEGTLRRLSGMFAFAYFDRDAGEVILARDRFGIKPLVVYADDRFVLFGSEVKAFAPWVTPAADLLPLVSVMMGFGQPTQGRSLYRNVRIVPPGTVMRVRPGEAPDMSQPMRLADMFDADVEAELAGMTPEAAVDRVDEQLQSAVDRMLFADAPVGALCSGGVDSSVLMAMAARKKSDLAIFHANVQGRFSEFESAAMLSKHLGLDLKAVGVGDDDFLRLIPEVIEHYEYPFSYHPNSVPFLMVARLVRQHGVKAVLSGEGSDECFLGYQHLAQAPFVRAWSRVSGSATGVLRRLPLIGRLMRSIDTSDADLVRGMMNGFERDLDEREVELEYFGRRSGPRDDNVQTLHLLSYHLRTLLHRNDCLGMAASIEARFPFLDESVVATAINLPRSRKIRFSPNSFVKAHPFLRDKWVLRRVADRYLPKELSRRRKFGFVTSAFSRAKISPTYFDASPLWSLFELDTRESRHLVGEATREMCMRLLLIDVWYRVCIQRESADRAADRIATHVTIASE